jgi:hypothetical protein
LSRILGLVYMYGFGGILFLRNADYIICACFVLENQYISQSFRSWLSGTINFFFPFLQSTLLLHFRRLGKQVTVLFQDLLKHFGKFSV